MHISIIQPKGDSLEGTSRDAPRNMSQKFINPTTKQNTFKEKTQIT